MLLLKYSAFDRPGCYLKCRFSIDEARLLLFCKYCKFVVKYHTIILSSLKCDFDS